MAQATSFMDVSKELLIPSNELKCNGFQHGDMFAVKVDKLYLVFGFTPWRTRNPN